MLGMPLRKQDAPTRTVAILAEFDSVDAILAAAEKVRDAGYKRWDVHAPFPVHGIDDAMGIKPTILPWLVLGGGITGCIGGLALAWYTNAFEYPFLISGKPQFSLPANIPVVFETTVLLSAFGAVFGMLGLNRLPWHYNPLFRKKGFSRVTNDRFVVVIEATDPLFDTQRTTELLNSLSPICVEEVED
jgi:hypothetical protein